MTSPTPPATPPGALKTWWIALRPFSFPASVMSVVFGVAIAVVVGHARLNLPLALLAAVGMALLHGGANVLNDVYDHKRGLDTQVLPVSGAVVRGLLTPARALRGALVLLAVGSLCGLAIVWAVGPVVLAIGAVGVLVGVLYSATPGGLKYHALGDASVFLNFGVLGALGGWVTQTRTLSWLPVVWSVPLSLLVVGILHANNWRDIAGDRAKNCVTVASLLGDERSVSYYAFLLFAPFVLVAGFIVVPRLAHFGTPMPVTFALVVLALPVAAKLMRRGLARKSSSNPLDFLALDGGTAQLELMFGVLCTVALALHAWTGF